jgi:hypothetical protein
VSRQGRGQETRSIPVRKRGFFECTGFLLVSFGLLAGCATRSAITMSASVVQRIFSAQGEIDQAALNPAFAYVRVTRAGSPAFLALGAHRLDGGLNRETYYSAQRETLELLDGRVVSLEADGEMFRWNTPSAPHWVSLEFEKGLLPKAGASLLSYDRSIDLQAPYRYGYQESITLRALPPSEATPRYIKRHDQSALVWFEETIVPAAGGTAVGMPWGVRKNLFGLDPKTHRVVYSEQCPYPAACFSIEQWQQLAQR